MRKHKNVEWTVLETKDGRPINWDMAQISVLMDIRDELQRLNTVMCCPNVQRGFRAMERMDRRLAKEVSLKAKKGKRP